MTLKLYAFSWKISPERQIHESKRIAEGGFSVYSHCWK